VTHDELERTDAEPRYRRLIESLPAIVYTESVDDDDLRVVFVSPQVRSLVGIDPDAWLGESGRWLASVHPDDRDRVAELDRVSEMTGQTFTAEYRVVAADGREVWFHDEAALVRDQRGRPLFWQGVMVDITERRRAEELERALEHERAETAELRALDELKSTFLQAVSHDLRTPLAAILGLAVTLEREDVILSADEARDLAGRIAVNARKLDRMVRDLLDVERAGRGALRPTLSSADVGRLVRTIVGASDAPAARDVHVAADPVTAAVDVAKVERIVENLLSNSLRHTPPDATIWVSVCDEGDDVLIAVDDEGPGVPPELQAEIFEPFRQGPDAPAHAPGVGIGLALVARFAELHGGRAWVQERQGGGASFRVRLPKRPPGEPGAAAQATGASSNSAPDDSQE
jgi:PAS domain S-box-containing protein